MEKIKLCWSLCDLLEYFPEKTSQITHINHMTLTSSGQILSWPDYRKTCFISTLLLVERSIMQLGPMAGKVQVMTVHENNVCQVVVIVYVTFTYMFHIMAMLS